MASFPHPSLRFHQANKIYRVGCRSLYYEFNFCAKSGIYIPEQFLLYFVLFTSTLVQFIDNR